MQVAEAEIEVIISISQIIGRSVAKRKTVKDIDCEKAERFIQYRCLHPFPVKPDVLERTGEIQRRSSEKLYFQNSSSLTHFMPPAVEPPHAPMKIRPRSNMPHAPGQTV